MPRPPMPTDSDSFSEETNSAIRRVLEARKSSPPPGIERPVVLTASSPHKALEV